MRPKISPTASGVPSRIWAKQSSLDSSMPVMPKRVLTIRATERSLSTSAAFAAAEPWIRLRLK